MLHTDKLDSTYTISYTRYDSWTLCSHTKFVFPRHYTLDVTGTQEPLLAPSEPLA